MIKAENIFKTYRSGRGLVEAMKGLTFDIGEGSTTALFGKSGSGKTTLLNCIGGLDLPNSGRLTVFDKELTAMSPAELCFFQRNKAGFVFQQGNLLSYLTVFENISFPLVLNGMDRESREKRVNWLLERIGLQDAGPAMPQELSGGENQRVAVARALAHYPALLLADEPTASLDTATGKMLIDLMVGIGREHNCTIIVATHDPGIIEAADVAIHLYDGRIVE